ncbi:hypothetical protein ES703_33380 [subsurface metagenome]
MVKNINIAKVLLIALSERRVKGNNVPIHIAKPIISPLRVPILDLILDCTGWKSAAERSAIIRIIPIIRDPSVIPRTNTA